MSHGGRELAGLAVWAQETRYRSKRRALGAQEKNGRKNAPEGNRGGKVQACLGERERERDFHLKGFYLEFQNIHQLPRCVLSGSWSFLIGEYQGSLVSAGPDVSHDIATPGLAALLGVELKHNRGLDAIPQFDQSSVSVVNRPKALFLRLFYGSQNLIVLRA